MALGLDASFAPAFIQYLFSSKPKFDCYFVVGNKSQGTPERIGAVKLMLMAHSEVFRLELEDSGLKEKGDVPVKDVHPDTFKGMLKYVYGHDTTAELCFDEADNMLYVAEKYLMKALKDKLAVRLMKLLNTDNICSLLNNPACYTHLELNSAITEILRYETDHVLASPEFLLMNADGFVKILEQDGLAVPEIELWRAAIKWAKHRANSEDGQLLRQQLSGLTQHMRLYSMTADEVLEVISSEVLTRHEIKTVSLYYGKKEEAQDLSDFCNITEPREMLQRKNAVQDALLLSNVDIYGTTRDKEYNCTLLTKKKSIELLPLVCRSEDRSNMNPENWTYKVECTISITKMANPKNPDDSSANEPPMVVLFCEQVRYGVEFEIPLAVNGKNITLLPDTKYAVKMVFHGDHRPYYNKKNIRMFQCDYLTLTVLSTWGDIYVFPFTKVHFRFTAEQPRGQ